MIKIPIVGVISQRLSHSAAPAAISEFAVPSTKQSSCQAFIASPAGSTGSHLSPVLQT